MDSATAAFGEGYNAKAGRLYQKGVQASNLKRGASIQFTQGENADYAEKIH